MINTICYSMKKTFWILVVILTTVHCKKESTSATPINALNILSTGRSAHDLLSADTYTQLNIEIEYMPGMQLQSESVNNLVNFLNTYLNKPGGITVTQKQVNSFNADTVSLRQVADFETQYRDTYTAGSLISAYILVSDANYSTTNVLGTAYLNTSLVMFEKNIRANSGGFGQATREKVESGVMEHEFGHLLGLVNLGTPM